MFTKMLVGLMLALGLFVSSSVVAHPRAADCCSLGLGCCTENSACCDGGVQPGCCEKGQQCCVVNKACCDASQSCCDQGIPCCDAPKACCDQRGNKAQ